MKRIEFYNRETEIKEIRDLLDSEPSLITFVYGPPFPHLIANF